MSARPAIAAREQKLRDRSFGPEAENSAETPSSVKCSQIPAAEILT